MCVFFVAQFVRLFSTPWTVAHKAPLSMGIIQARILEWVAMPSSREIFPTQGSNPDLPHCRQISLRSEPPRRSLVEFTKSFPVAREICLNYSSWFCYFSSLSANVFGIFWKEQVAKRCYLMPSPLLMFHV